jgi:hypothetical protein
MIIFEKTGWKSGLKICTRYWFRPTYFQSCLVKKTSLIIGASPLFFSQALLCPDIIYLFFLPLVSLKRYCVKRLCLHVHLYIEQFKYLTLLKHRTQVDIFFWGKIAFISEASVNNTVLISSQLLNRLRCLWWPKVLKYFSCKTIDVHERTF